MEAESAARWPGRWLCPFPGRSNRADMTGQRGPRHTVARPARTIATAPPTAAAGQGTPAMMTCPEEPAMTIACEAPPGDAPPVVDPPSAPAAASAWAVASTPEADTPAAAATAAPAPRQASRAPATRRAVDLVAITAARQASPARARALASGTSCWPVTGICCAGSGRGGVKTARGHVCRTANTTRPAPAAPSSSTSPNSLRVAGISGYCSLSSTSASKQVRSPVWQAAPTWSTRTRTASPSQSRATDLTHCWCPEVSPFTQYSWRLRDQYVHRPVVRVRCRASSSIQPSISTSPVSYCWAIAAIRPSEFRLRRAATLGSSSDGRTASVIVDLSSLPVSLGAVTAYDLQGELLARRTPRPSRTAGR